MSDFDKAKIGFALALLGTVFTIHPILQPVLATRLLLPLVSVPLSAFYLAFVGLLVLSVYCFALDMIYEAPISRLRSAGTSIYAIALVLPPLTFGLVALSWVVRAVAPYAQILSSIISIVAAILSVLLALRQSLRVRELLVARDRISTEFIATRAEAAHLSRAKQMQALGHNDLAALEAWLAVEVAMRSALFRAKPKGGVPVNPKTRVELAVSTGIVPPGFAERLHWLRKLRNDAAHGGGSISDQEAASAVETAIQLLGAIERPALDEGE